MPEINTLIQWMLMLAGITLLLGLILAVLNLIQMWRNYNG